MIKAIICMGIGFNSGTHYIPTLGFRSGTAPLVTTSYAVIGPHVPMHTRGHVIGFLLGLIGAI